MKFGSYGDQYGDRIRQWLEDRMRGNDEWAKAAEEAKQQQAAFIERQELLQDAADRAEGNGDEIGRAAMEAEAVAQQHEYERDVWESVRSKDSLAQHSQDNADAQAQTAYIQSELAASRENAEQAREAADALAANVDTSQDWLQHEDMQDIREQIEQGQQQGQEETQQLAQAGQDDTQAIRDRQRAAFDRRRGDLGPVPDDAREGFADPQPEETPEIEEKPDYTDAKYDDPAERLSAMKEALPHAQPRFLELASANPEHFRKVMGDANKINAERKPADQASEGDSPKATVTKAFEDERTQGQSQKQGMGL